ncbi:hypothetical protein R3P38DRAFT_3179065 [Favolaschia claudopus]|uniref:Uncharacterized protein n=1 Tax=Favolaschia claudopus TaxID=2862362 RepID=A0AAW0CUU6_9AGAR
MSFDALASLQKENARLRQLLAPPKYQASVTVDNSPSPPSSPDAAPAVKPSVRGEDEDELESEGQMGRQDDDRPMLLEQIKRLESDNERLKQGSALQDRDRERLVAENYSLSYKHSTEKSHFRGLNKSLQEANRRLIAENHAQAQQTASFQAHVVHLMQKWEVEKAGLIRLNDTLSAKLKGVEEKLVQAEKTVDDLKRRELSQTPTPTSTPTMRAMMGPKARSLQEQILNPHRMRRTESLGAQSTPQSTPHRPASGRASSPIMLLSPPPSSSPAQPMSPLSRKRTRAAYENGEDQENVRPVGRMGPIDLGGPHKRSHTTPSATASLLRQPFISSLGCINAQPPHPQEHTRLWVPQGKLRAPNVGGAPKRVVPDPQATASPAPAWPYPPSTAPSVNNAQTPPPQSPQMKLQQSLHHTLLFSTHNQHYVKCRLCPLSPKAYVTAKISPWHLLVEHIKSQHVEEYNILLRLRPEQLGEWEVGNG